MTLTDELRRKLLVRMFRRANGDPKAFADRLLATYGAALDVILTNEATDYKIELQANKSSLQKDMQAINSDLTALA